MNESNVIKKYAMSDKFARHVGIEFLEADNGRAKAKMVIQEHHLNATKLVHGGAIFSLADYVFALASNSHGSLALGVNVSMSYLKAVAGGALTGEAEEISRNARLATYSIRIMDERDDIVALFQGTVYRKKERLEDLLE